MTKLRNSTPRAEGFQMPAEWAQHANTWMLWPERTDNWRMGAKPAQKAFVAVAEAISQFEPVTMGVSHGQFQNARNLLPPFVRVVEMSHNDAWMRDCGPTFVVNGRDEVRVVDWIFNAWGGLKGGLYFPWDLDDMVAQKVADLEDVDRYRAPLVLEGGSIHVDGEGTLLTTEECLLNENRNPEFSKEEIELHLMEYTGALKIIWLGAGVYNDETNGHVDNIACFLQPGLVALTWTDDHNDPQYPRSKDAFDRLSKATDAKGRKLGVIKIHQPDPVTIAAHESEGVDTVEGSIPRSVGDRMAASYINFYFCNGGIILPTFKDSHDKLAMDALQKANPGRRVIGVPAHEILLGGGNIHCITQQQPKG
jgi:agmatine deiminase